MRNLYALFVACAATLSASAGFIPAKAPHYVEDPAATSIYIPEFEIQPGKTAEVDIMLSNPDYMVTAVQFNMTLPEGLSIVEEGGEYFVDPGTRATRSHVTASSCVDGEYRILSYSNSNADFKGNDGAIILITFQADETYNGGTISLTGVIATESNGTQHSLADSQTVLPALAVEPDPDPEEGLTKIYLPNFDIQAGETKEIDVYLDNPDYKLTAVQFNMILPEGLEVEEKDGEYFVDPGSRCSRSHVTASSYVDGEYRVLCYSNSNADFKDGENGIIVITFKALEGFVSGDVKLTGVIATESNGTEHSLEDTTALVNEASGLNSVVAEEGEARFYTPAGIEVANPQQGVYIRVQGSQASKVHVK